MAQGNSCAVFRPLLHGFSMLFYRFPIIYGYKNSPVEPDGRTRFYNPYSLPTMSSKSIICMALTGHTGTHLPQAVHLS